MKVTVVKPGRVIDFHSKQDLGPASYELSLQQYHAQGPVEYIDSGMRRLVLVQGRIVVCEKEA